MLHLERKLGKLALFLVLLSPQLHFFQDWIKGNGTFKTQECYSTEIKITHAPLRVSENYFSQGISGKRDTPLPLIMLPEQKNHDSQLSYKQKSIYLVA